MNTDTLTIRVDINRAAALLRGNILGETADIAVSPAGMGEQWPYLVAALDMSSNPVRVRRYALAEASEAALREKIAESRAAEAAEEAEQIRENIAKLEAWEADPISRCERNDYGYAWERWEVTYLPSWGKLPEDWESRKAATITRIDAEIDAHNTPLLAAVEQAKAAQEARMAKEAEERKAAEATALIERKAKRLESGVWTKEVSSYNERREGKPWVAKVSLEGGKLAYAFGGNFTGGWGKGGELSIECRPGEIIAWGQKDLRCLDRSAHHILRMAEDGGMVKIDKTEATHYLRDAAKA